MSFDFTKYRSLMEANKRIYFIGIGGISMSGLAELAMARGQIVGGSDLSKNDRCQELEALGIKLYFPQVGENIEQFKPDAVVYSAAVPSDNPERVKAKDLGIISIERSDWLGLLNREHKEVINIAGTNGKSTTTAMTAAICLDAGLDPTVHLGAQFARFNSTIHVGSENLMISEACEFNKSFLSFHSTIAAILNLGHDHVDCFPTMDDVLDVFLEFILRLPKGSKLVIPAFDPYIPQLLSKWREKYPDHANTIEILSFGYPENELLGKAPDLIAKDLTWIHGLPHFDLIWKGKAQGKIELSLPGRFNVDNALAALLMSKLAGASFEQAAKSLASFQGAEGRFTYCGEFQGARVFNDYAHHPDSVKLTLEAAKKLPHKNLYACFQPITFSRAKGLFGGFVEAMQELKPAILVEVYDDREKDRSFSSRQIADTIIENGGEALFFESPAKLELYLREKAHKDDLIILMGQDIRQVGDKLTGRSSHYQAQHSLREVFDDQVKD